MKKFNSLICASILAVVGLVSVCDSTRASDKNIGIDQYSIDSLNTACLDVIFFNNYTENTAGEIFSGSSTTSGGTTTSSNGAINIAGWAGTKYCGLTLAPGGAGGSITVNFYGISGTTTIASGTTNAYLLQNPTSYSITAATSTSFSITQNPTMMLCSVNVTVGTVTTTLGMHTSKAK